EGTRLARVPFTKGCPARNVATRTLRPCARARARGPLQHEQERPCRESFRRARIGRTCEQQLEDGSILSELERAPTHGRSLGPSASGRASEDSPRGTDR